MSKQKAKICYLCQVDMRHAGKAPFRVGGTRGVWKLVVGEWAELGEGLLPLNLYVCPECGRIELYADEGTKLDLITGVQGTVEKKE